MLQCPIVQKKNEKFGRSSGSSIKDPDFKKSAPLTSLIHRSYFTSIEAQFLISFLVNQLDLTCAESQFCMGRLLAYKGHTGSANSVGQKGDDELLIILFCLSKYLLAYKDHTRSASSVVQKSKLSIPDPLFDQFPKITDCGAPFAFIC